jgi:hypothetical protein
MWLPCQYTGSEPVQDGPSGVEESVVEEEGEFVEWYVHPLISLSLSFPLESRSILRRDESSLTLALTGHALVRFELTPPPASKSMHAHPLLALRILRYVISPDPQPDWQRPKPQVAGRLLSRWKPQVSPFVYERPSWLVALALCTRNAGSFFTLDPKGRLLTPRL